MTHQTNVRIKDDEASGMALFTAEHIPMMNCLSKGARTAQERVLEPSSTRLPDFVLEWCFRAGALYNGQLVSESPR